MGSQTHLHDLYGKYSTDTIGVNNANLEPLLLSLGGILHAKPNILTYSAHANSPPSSPPAVADKPATSMKQDLSSEQDPVLFEKGIAGEILVKFGQVAQIIFIKHLRIKIAVEPSNILRVATYIRDRLGFDHAESVAGTDYPKDNQVEVIYHLGSYTRQDLAGQIISVATRTNRDDPTLPSLIGVYKSVEYHEREIFEMLGIYFEGHPRNERFLLPEDWADIPPLRKEFRIKGR
jgi:NADH:ubiquinone oxidoreductase subunit C